MQWNTIFKLILQAATFELVLNGQLLYYSFLFYAISLWCSWVLNFSPCHKGSEINRGQISWEARPRPEPDNKGLKCHLTAGQGWAGRQCPSPALPLRPLLRSPSTTPGRVYPLPRPLPSRLYCWLPKRYFFNNNPSSRPIFPKKSFCCEILKNIFQGR